jgi:sugar-specific transcriptional regulator TrmB
MSDPDDVFELLGLTEYERSALRELLSLGRTTAPNLAEATGITKARIYGVLDGLSDRGFIKVIPARPKEYQAKAPAEILDRAIENRRQDLAGFESNLADLRDPFLEKYEPRYERAGEDISAAAELFHVVDLGEPSERETRRLYKDAADVVYIVTKSFEYFDAVEPAFADALDRGVDVSVLFLDPDELSAENREYQAQLVARLVEEYPAADLRFSAEKLPFRGTFADPSMAYDSGTAILLVEAANVPYHRRQAAITENEAFVAGLKRYFDLIWQYESTPFSSVY